jgi:hypothetical protein
MGLIVPGHDRAHREGPHRPQGGCSTRVDKAVLWLMIAALALRVVAPQLAPAPTWRGSASPPPAGSPGLRHPRLAVHSHSCVQPRIDGREH